MGSGVSSLPESLTEEEAKRFARNKFNQEQFDQLKAEDGTISRSNFLMALESVQEHDLHDVFMKFSPNGQMDSRTFVKMMKDTKLLNSKTFTNADADIIFQKAKARLGTSFKAIPYELFHETVIPEVALKKNMDVRDVIFEITKTSGPVLNGTQADDVRLHNAPARRASDAGKTSSTIAKIDEKLMKSPTLVDDLHTEALQSLFM